MTDGATVSTVKVRFAEVLVLFAPSQQLTDQLWLPWVKFAVAVVV